MIDAEITGIRDIFASSEEVRGAECHREKWRQCLDAKAGRNWDIFASSEEVRGAECHCEEWGPCLDANAQMRECQIFESGIVIGKNLSGENEVMKRRTRMHYNIDKILREELEAVNFLLEKVNDVIGKREELTAKAVNGELVYSRRYYTVDQEGNRHRRAEKLGGERNERVIEIKQNAFNLKLKERLEEAKKFLVANIGKYKGYDIDEIDEALPKVYRDNSGLVNKDPLLMSAEEWSRKPYKRNSFPKGPGRNVTSDGTEVRSKGEIIIYDQLYFLSVPFQNDVEVILKDRSGRPIRRDADFRFFSLREIKPVLEHLGMLSDDYYLEKSMVKVKEYIEAGYTLNVDLFLTADDCFGKTDAYATMQLIKKMILPNVQMKKDEK